MGGSGDDAVTVKCFTLRLSAVLRGIRTSLINPQISLPVGELCVKTSASTDISLLQKGNQPALLMVVRAPKNFHIGVLSVPTSYHT